MCRLYALQATHPTRAACELLDAQNALLHQSRMDGRGLANPDGWGVGSLTDGTVHCVRQVKPASESEEYRTQALQSRGTTLLAHVRRATVGEPSHDNTHPFRHGSALLIHNGHVPAFDEVRPLLLERLTDEVRHSIRGSTDSEHILALLLQLRKESPDRAIHEITRQAIQSLQQWCEEVSSGVRTGISSVQFDDLDTVADDVIHNTLALNVLWTDGSWLGGARFNRSLWSLRRTQSYVCSICGDDHTDAPESEPYRAVVLASERITDEEWTEVPNGSVFHVADDGILDCYAV